MRYSPDASLLYSFSLSIIIIDKSTKSKFMSEQPFSDQPAIPPPGGWDHVAAQYKDWHPGLHGHVERLLEVNGITPPGDVNTPTEVIAVIPETIRPDEPRELPNANILAEETAPPVDVTALKLDLSTRPYETVKRESLGLFGEPKTYGVSECLALLQSGELDVATQGIRLGRFKDLDSQSARQLIDGGSQVTVNGWLASFNDLDEQIAYDLIATTPGKSVFGLKETFASFDQNKLADYAVSIGKGEAFMDRLEAVPEVDPSRVLPALEESGQHIAILMGVLAGRLPQVDQQALVNKLVAEHKSANAIFGIDNLTGIDKAAFGQQIVDHGDLQELLSVFNYIDRFPRLDTNKLIKRVIDEGTPDNLYSVQALIGKEGIEAATYQKFISACMEHGQTTAVARSLDMFPDGMVDHQALADTIIERFNAGTILDISVLTGYLDKFSGLSAITYDELLDLAGDKLYSLRHSLGSFTSLSPHAAAVLCDHFAGIENVVEHLDKFDMNRKQLLDLILSKSGGLSALAAKADAYPEEQQMLVDKIMGGAASDVSILIQNLQRFTDIDRASLASQLLDKDVSGVFGLISNKEYFGLDAERLGALLGSSENRTLQLLAADEGLLSLLPADGPFGATFGRAAVKVLLGSEHPEQTIDSLNMVAQEQSLWLRNLRISQIAAGEISKLGFLADYMVEEIPLSFPVEAKEGTYEAAALMRPFAEMSDDEKRMVMSKEALEQLSSNQISLDTKVTVGFTELSADWQENVLGYRLYQSIGRSRNERERSAASEQNRRFAESENWMQAGDLVHATGTVANGANLLRNGLLCGEAIGLQAQVDGFPFNVDFVSVSSEVLAGSTHRERLDNLKNRSYGDYVFLLHRTADSTDAGRETIGGLNEDHRLIFGAVPATEISALLLRGVDADIEAAIGMVVESGMYIPVVDNLGNNLLSYDDYQARRLDGNYAAAIPQVIDSSFKLDGTQLGSNEGAMYVAPVKNRQQADHYYVKFGDESADKRDHLWTEILADELYRTVTPELVPETAAVIIDGRLARRSKIAPTDEEAVTNEARNAGFIMDCLIGNWDAVYNDANLLMSDGKALRIDTGNSFDFRARGDKKDADQFSERVLEVEIGTSADELGGGMRQMYSDITDDEIKDQVKRLRESLTDTKIDELVHSIRRPSGDRLRLASIVKARKNYLIQKFL